MTQQYQAAGGYVQAPIGAAYGPLGTVLYDPDTDKVYVHVATGWVYIGAGLDVATAAAGTGASGAGGTGASGGTAATATVAGHVRLTDVLAATTTGKATQYDLAGGPGSMASLVQPDVPRPVRLTITDANASISAYQITVTGTLASGLTAQTEVFTFANGLTPTGAKAFAVVTSVTIDSITGAAAGDTLDLGYGNALGIPMQGTLVGVFKANVDNVGEAVGTVDTTNGTIIPTTAPNGARDYDFWYTYTLTGASHTHTGPSHTHTGPSHTHTATVT